MSDYNNSCPLCGEIWNQNDTKVECSFCKTLETADFLCPNKHYICEDCRTNDPREVVAKICHITSEIDPMTLWDLITAMYVFRTHGPQFHFVVAPILAAVLRNRHLLSISFDELKALTEKLSEIPALSCSTIGVCGAAASAGSIVSLLTGAKPTSDLERRLVLQATAKAINAIAQNSQGRCCRQSSLTTIKSTWSFLKNNLQLPLEEISLKCKFSNQIQDCKEDCCFRI